MTKNTIELAIDKEYKERVPQLVETLMDNGYVCMLSYEEQLIIINCIWTYEAECDRNRVVFMSDYDFEENYADIVKDEEEE